MANLSTNLKKTVIFIHAEIEEIFEQAILPPFLSMFRKRGQISKILIGGYYSILFELLFGLFKILIPPLLVEK